MESPIMLIVIVLSSITIGTGESQQPETYFTRVQTLDLCYEVSGSFLARPQLLDNRVIIGTACVDASGTSTMSQLQDFSVENAIRSKINSRKY